MSASFYDLLKYAKTGLASPGMTAYDKMRALAMSGGGTVQTLTGIPPLSFKADGRPLISWSMKGNGQQQGTPTPDNPVMPTFCGVRTANLFDKDNANILNAYINPTSMMIKLTAGARCFWIACDANATYSISRLAGKRFSAAWAETEPAPDVSVYGIVTENGATNLSITTGSMAKYLVVFYYNSNYDTLTEQQIRDSIMLNLGSTALPYEPYGWAEKITCAGQTVPVYLGEVQTTRQVKKLVLDGTENWRIWEMSASSTAERFYMNISGAGSFAGICSHFPLGIDNSDTIHFRIGGATNNELLFWIDKQEASTVADFKAYLAAQYSAGTPVTVWYVLANEQTGIVNEPLCKIGDYADELSSTDAGVTIPTAKGGNTLTVDTDLQPSEMTITFKG